ncbi:hypothetical protein BSBH6_04191 [Bacillus subtilis]|nr:hypothetical protein BSBH6_04191 [Bacillus subtilis]RPK19839.1 hypothetical protein BH5_04192 [Bacillus subtilis]
MVSFFQADDSSDDSPFPASPIVFGRFYFLVFFISSKVFQTIVYRSPNSVYFSKQ